MIGMPTLMEGSAAFIASMYASALPANIASWPAFATCTHRSKLYVGLIS
jgi:hypothetical protein